MTKKLSEAKLMSDFTIIITNTNALLLSYCLIGLQKQVESGSNLSLRFQKKVIAIPLSFSQLRQAAK